jgi:hypothetical protein
MGAPRRHAEQDLGKDPAGGMGKVRQLLQETDRGGFTHRGWSRMRYGLPQRACPPISILSSSYQGFGGLRAMRKILQFSAIGAIL